MHIVIGGGAELAFTLADELDDEHEIVMILPADAPQPVGDRLDISVTRGNLSSPVTLREAGAAEADVFIACTYNNETNLVACVAAKQLGAARTTCFLFARDFRASPEEDEALARSLGIDNLVRPATQLAEEIVRIVAVPGALDVEAFAGGRVRLLRYVVEEGAPLTQGPLAKVKIPSGVVLVMGRRDDRAFIPRGDTQFAAGDKVTAMGTPAAVAEFRRLLHGAGHIDEGRSATVVGGGMVGLAIAQGLERLRWTVKVIESDLERCEQISPLLQSMVLHGDGADRALLEQEQVTEDAVVIAVTSNDEKNLLVSLMAKDMGVPRIITRAEIPANERLFDRVGIDVVRSAAGASIHSVVRGLVSGRKGLLAELEHGDAEILEVELPGGLPATAVASLRQPVFAVIGAILRGQELIIPKGDDEIRGGDHILVFCARDDESAVRAFFDELAAEHVKSGIA